MKKSIFCFALFMIAINAYSQITIKGTVRDNTEEKLAVYSNVSLLSPDSTYLNGCSSDGNGNFVIKTKPGSYFIKISCIGYKTELIELKNLEKSVDLGEVVLVNDAILLADVTVSASNISHRVDRMIIQPTESQVKNSYDAYELVNNMALPRLQVDPLMKTMKVSGDQNVQVRINGIKVVSSEELSAIRSQDILRIEYIDSPSIRYEEENLGAVINVITKRRATGGILNLQLMDSPHVLFGQNSFDLKINHNNSEWGVSYSNRNRGSKHTSYDVSEKFILESGVVERIQDGLDDKNKSFHNNINLSYNYYLPDKTIFNVIFRNEFNNIPYDNRSSIITENLVKYYSFTNNKSKTYSPVVDIYFKQYLKNTQSFEFNLVTTYIESKNFRKYQKNDKIDNELYSTITDVDGGKYSVIAEGIYDKEFKNLKLTGGMRHFQMNAENKYNGRDPIKSDMDQSRSSIFTEIQGSYKKFNYLVGIGLTRTWFKENEESHTYYILNPNIRIGISPHKSGYLNYQFNIIPSIPSLSSLTDIEQPIDDIQISKGNPSLKTYKTFSNSLTYSLSQKKMRENIYVNYQYFDDPIMETIYISDDNVFLMDQNQPSFQKFNVELSWSAGGLNIRKLNNFLTLEASVGYTYFDSKGNGYHYTYDNIYFNFMAMMMYKKWMLMGQYRKYQNSLWGETLQKGTDMTAIMLNYRFKNMQAGIGMTYPFASKFKEGNQRLNEKTSMQSWKYVKETTQMVVLRFSYNFEFGRKHKSGAKDLNNVDTETGIIKINR